MTTRRTRWTRALSALAAFALAGFALTGCITIVPPDQGQGAGGWTIMTFEIADTNLEPFMMDDVEEQGKVGTQPGLNLISYIDRSDQYTDTPVIGLPDWTGAKVIEVQKNAPGKVLETVGPVDTGDPSVLAGFIKKTIAAYPAAHYGLIISDHGASWPGVGADGSANNDGLTLDEMHTAIRDGLAGSNVGKLDLLGLDACLMANYETATGLAPYANRLIASEELEPGHGWDYTALQAAADGADVDQLASAVITGFHNQAVQQGDDANITLAEIDLTKIGAVDSAMADFTKAMTDNVLAVAPQMGRSLAQTVSFGTSPDPSQDLHMTDLAELASRLSDAAPAVKPQADALVAAVKAAVLDQTTGDTKAGATGLSIYFPQNYGLYDKGYDNIVTPGNWQSFLSAYYQAGLAIPTTEQASFAGQNHQADVSFGSNGLTISGTFTLQSAPNLAEAYIIYGIAQPDGSIDYFGDEPATIATDGSGLASGTFNLTQLTISDGTTTSSAYLSLFNDANNTGAFTIDVPMAYYSPGDVNGETYQDALLELSLDATGSVTSETYYAYDQATSTYGELTADPAGTIVPQIDHFANGADTWTATNATGLLADPANLQYNLAALPSGTQLQIELWVVDYGGNSDYVSSLVTVP